MIKNFTMSDFHRVYWVFFHLTNSQNWWTDEPRLSMFLANSNLVILVLWLIRGLNLLVWLLYFGSRSLLRTVNCGTSTPALWRLLATSLIVVLGFFSTALTMFHHHLLMFFLRLPVRHLLLSSISGFSLLKDIPNGCIGYGQCAIAPIDFSSSLSFIIACFCPIDSSVVFMLVTPFWI